MWAPACFQPLELLLQPGWSRCLVAAQPGARRTAPWERWPYGCQLVTQLPLVHFLSVKKSIKVRHLKQTQRYCQHPIAVIAASPAGGRPESLARGQADARPKSRAQSCCSTDHKLCFLDQLSSTGARTAVAALWTWLNGAVRVYFDAEISWVYWEDTLQRAVQLLSRSTPLVNFVVPHRVLRVFAPRRCRTRRTHSSVVSPEMPCLIGRALDGSCF